MLKNIIHQVLSYSRSKNEDFYVVIKGAFRYCTNSSQVGLTKKSGGGGKSPN
jgi:hypothetical protein